MNSPLVFLVISALVFLLVLLILPYYSTASRIKRLKVRRLILMNKLHTPLGAKEHWLVNKNLEITTKKINRLQKII